MAILAASAPPNPHSFKLSVSSYLDNLPAPTLGRLYEAPSSSLAIFRLLPPNARYIVLTMLWNDAGVSRADLDLTARRNEGKRQLESSLAALARLHILDQAGSQSLLRLDPTFGQSLRHALTGGGTRASFGAPCDEPDRDSPTELELDHYATRQWEAMLHFLVGSESSSRPADSVLHLLVHSELMTKTSGKRYDITARGFQFLLEEVNTQLWDLLLKYIGLAEREGRDPVDVLGFYFMLGSLTLGADYSTEHLTETQRDCVGDLAALGLIYQHSHDDERFYPTRLATTLTSTAAPLLSANAEAVSDDPTEQGFLLLETNYRVYAYTKNPLQIAVLKLFVSLRARFGNLVMGYLSRDSVRGALDRGIAADQIIAYMSAHAHPQMRKQAAAGGPDRPLLPPTVTDQIRLWEIEKDRVKTSPGYLYTAFSSQSDFDVVRHFAHERGVVLWESAIEGERRLFITNEGHIAVKDFVQSRKV